VKLAESQGVGGEKVTKGTDLERLKRGTRRPGGKPYLIDVTISATEAARVDVV